MQSGENSKAGHQGRNIRLIKNAKTINLIYVSVVFIKQQRTNSVSVFPFLDIRLH